MAFSTLLLPLLGKWNMKFLDILYKKDEKGKLTEQQKTQVRAHDNKDLLTVISKARSFFQTDLNRHASRNTFPLKNDQNITRITNRHRRYRGFSGSTILRLFWPPRHDIVRLHDFLKTLKIIKKIFEIMRRSSFIMF